jgi:hypothetical protein
VFNFNEKPNSTLTWHQLDEDVVPVFRETKKTSKDSSPTGDVPLETDFEFVDLGETGKYIASGRSYI